MITNCDHFILLLFHQLAIVTHNVFLPIALFLDWMGSGKALPIICIPLILLVLKKTRTYGMIMLISLVVGFIITNLCLKNLVQRPRPFQSFQDIALMKQMVGNVTTNDFSFPSGHTTSSTALVVPLLLLLKGKKKYLFLLFPLIMGFSRMYLLVHYPTDVLAGFLIGCFAGSAAVKFYHIFSHN